LASPDMALRRRILKCVRALSGLAPKGAYIRTEDARGNRAGALAKGGPIPFMSGFFDVYSIIFLIVAVVIFMRLGSVLGRRTGNEPTSFDASPKRPTRPAAPSGNDNVVTLPRREQGAETRLEAAYLEAVRRHAEPNSELHAKLMAVVKAMPSFDPDHFLSGAKAAYEMIVTSFADGDRSVLKNLLAPEVYEGFVAAMDEREARGERVESTFVGIEDARISDAEVDGRIVRISVRFVSELISATRNKAGQVVEGDPTAVQNVRDVWTFARDATSRDPNWKLVATEAV
jgi:predicted lipid-binding transport protein (Tim44 family)